MYNTSTYNYLSTLALNKYYYTKLSSEKCLCDNMMNDKQSLYCPYFDTLFFKVAADDVKVSVSVSSVSVAYSL